MSKPPIEVKNIENNKKNELRLIDKGDLVDIHYQDGKTMKDMIYLGFGGDGIMYILDNEDKVVGVRNWVVIRTSNPKDKYWMERVLK